MANNTNDERRSINTSISPPFILRPDPSMPGVTDGKVRE